MTQNKSFLNEKLREMMFLLALLSQFFHPTPYKASMKTSKVLTPKLFILSCSICLIFYLNNASIHSTWRGNNKKVVLLWISPSFDPSLGQFFVLCTLGIRASSKEGKIRVKSKSEWENRRKIYLSFSFSFRLVLPLYYWRLGNPGYVLGQINQYGSNLFLSLGFLTKSGLYCDEYLE